MLNEWLSRFAITNHISQLKSWKINRLNKNEKDETEMIEETKAVKDTVGCPEAKTITGNKIPILRYLF